MSGPSDYYTNAVLGSPSLVSQPDLILAAGQSQDPYAAAQALSQGSAIGGSYQAANKSHHRNWLSQAIGDVGSAIGDVADKAGEGAGWLVEKTHLGTPLEYMSKPLQEIQHDYRFIHDLWVKGDPTTATLATLGVVIGGSVGAIFGGPSGAELGIGLVGMGEGKLAEAGLLGQGAKQAYVQSANEKISPGRDLANLIGLHNTDTGWGKVISGTGDLVFDFSLDPVAAVGKLGKATRSSRGLSTTYAARRFDGYNAWLLRNGLAGRGLESDPAGITALQRVDGARNSPIPGLSSSYERALEQIARTVRDNKGSEIGALVDRFPELQRMNAFLAHADTADKVHDVFRAQAVAADLGHSYNLLPSVSLARRALQPAADKLQTFGGTTLAEEGSLRSALNPKSDVKLRGAVARKVRRTTNYLPYVIDRTEEEGQQVLRLSRDKFDLMDPGSLKAIKDALRFSKSELEARTIVHDIAVAQISGDEAQVRTIWLRSHKSMLLDAGLDQTHRLVQNVMDEIEVAHRPTDRAYGYSPETGRDINYIDVTVPALPTDPPGTVATTRRVAAGIWDSQASTKASFPNFNEVMQAVRGTNNIGKAFNTVDEWLARGYTNSVFKPLALVNSGFGLRVALAEAIPAAFRYGGLHMLQGRVASSLAKLDRRSVEGTRLHDEAAKAFADGDLKRGEALTKQADKSELGHLTAAVAYLLGGASKALRTDPERMKVAAQLVHDHNGQIVHGPSKAGHSMHIDHLNPVDKANNDLWGAQNRMFGQRKTGGWSITNPNHNEQFGQHWHAHHATIASNDAGRRIATDLGEHLDTGMELPDAMHAAILDEAARIRDPQMYLDGKKRLTRYDQQDPDMMAADRVADLVNVVKGQDGTLHRDLLNHLADGTTPALEHFQGIDAVRSPAGIPTAMTTPIATEGWYQTLIGKGFKFLVDPIINGLSREPMYLNAVMEELPALRNAVEKGIIDEPQMYREAYYRATEKILPQIHNVQLRSQFSALTRNLLPFYFAQEQALRRVVHLGSVDPSAIRRYQLIEHALTDPGWVHTDDQGNRSIILPLAGGTTNWLLKGAQAIGLPVQAGLPLTFTGSTASLKTVLPELQTPGTSPLLSVSLNAMAHYFPEWSPVAKKVVGERGYGQSVRDSLIPNQLAKTWLHATSGPDDKQMANAMMSALTAAAAHGQIPPADEMAANPRLKQDFLEKIKNNARTILLMKGILATFSPLTPKAIPEDFGLRDEFYKIADTPGMTYPKAVEKFLAKHGTSYASYTMAKTENLTGAYVPDTQAALEFINTHRGSLSDNIAMAYFIPETTDASADAQIIHSELVNMHLRETMTPSAFLDQMYIKSGSTEYRASKKLHDEYLKTLTDASAIDAENKSWSDWVEQQKLSHPLWAEDFTSEQRVLRAHTIYDNMIDLFDRNQVPMNSQTASIKELIDSYQLHLAYINTEPDPHRRQVERDDWTTYLNDLADKQPELNNVIDNVFGRLDRRV